MSETGMVLSNPYGGVRVPGTVGQPLPGVEVKILAPAADTDVGGAAALNGGGGNGGGSGELAVRGDMLFKEYWRRPDATEAAFDADGFFLTGAGRGGPEACVAAR